MTLSAPPMLMTMLADAATAAPQDPFGGFGLIIMMSFTMLVVWLMILRPQKRKDDELRRAIDAMKKGDRVMTTAGILGTVVTVRDKEVVIRTGDDTKITMVKHAVHTVLERGSEASATAAASDAESNDDDADDSDDAAATPAAAAAASPASNNSGQVNQPGTGGGKKNKGKNKRKK
ncbi:MAG: preprotein translocase subunit YajC [Planctomycetota bacterium]